MKRDMNHHQQVQALELEALTLGYPTASGLQVSAIGFFTQLGARRNRLFARAIGLRQDYGLACDCGFSSAAVWPYLLDAG
jgi:hypothetical protein